MNTLHVFDYLSSERLDKALDTTPELVFAYTFRIGRKLGSL